MTTEFTRRVDPARLRSLALAAALVGVFAGLVAATFASIAGEPEIQRAIAIEEANAAAEPPMADAGHSHQEEARVSRADQRGIGLFGAYALTGAAFGALVALTAYGLRRGRPDASRRVLLAGAILAGGFTLAPWFKYPPNPPAVGDPSTLSQRQGLYVAIICIAIIVGLAATIVSRRLREASWPDHRRLAVVAATVAIPMLLAYVIMPPAPDAVTVPATLVWKFRLASLGANLTLWSVLTFALSWLVGAAAARRSTPPTAATGATPAPAPATATAPL